MIPGFALIEELEIMESFGLSTLETLKAATTNAADAMGRSDRIGRIEPGLQADFILLSANPLDGVGNLRALEGVMVRGHWIDEPASLRLPVSAYDGTTDAMTRENLLAAVGRAEYIYGNGYVPSSLDLESWAQMMAGQGHDDLAQRLLALRVSAQK